MVSRDLTLPLRSIQCIMLKVVIKQAETKAVSQGLALRLRSKLWIILQVCLQLLEHQVGGGKGWRHKARHCACTANCGLCCKFVYSYQDIRQAEAKAGVTRPGIAPTQQIVDYIASMLSGRQRRRLVSQDLALRLRSILGIMLQVCFQLPRTSGRRMQRPLSRGQALRLRSILWIMLQVCLQLLGIRQEETKVGVTRPGIALAQHIVDYIASMFTAARTSGRQRQRLALQCQAAYFHLQTCNTCTVWRYFQINT